MKRAYSLVELLVTMSILTLLAAFTVPTFQLILAQYELSQTTTQVANFLRLTEQKTVTEQQIYGITLTANATTISQYIYNPTTSAKTIQTSFSLPVNTSIGAVNFSGNNDITFSTAGSPSTSGNFTILDTIRNRTQQIDIRPSGGIFISGEH